MDNTARFYHCGLSDTYILPWPDVADPDYIFLKSIPSASPPHTASPSGEEDEKVFCCVFPHLEPWLPAPRPCVVQSLVPGQIDLHRILPLLIVPKLHGAL